MSSHATGAHPASHDTSADTAPPFPREAVSSLPPVAGPRPPAVRVFEGRLDPRSPWQPTAAQRAGVERTLRSVGRIQQDDLTLGTGFLVAPTIVMTNRHVAESFCTDVDGTLKIRIGWTPTIDFIAERLPSEVGPSAPPDAPDPPHHDHAHHPAPGGTHASGNGHAERADAPAALRRARFAVSSVLYTHDVLDLALLRVTLDPDKAVSPLPADWVTPAPLRLGVTRPDPLPTAIYLVGFPFNDPTAGDDELNDVFGHVFDVKRVQPGTRNRLDEARKELGHTASTLRGNSGSCVVDLDTHEVVALHYQGSREEQGKPARNLAVALWLLDEETRAAMKATGVDVGPDGGSSAS